MTLLGHVAALKETATKSGNRMAFVTPPNSFTRAPGPSFASAPVGEMPRGPTRSRYRVSGWPDT